MATNTYIAKAVNDFSKTVDDIVQLSAAQQSNNPKGYTSKKDQDLENLVNLCYKLALRIKNYAVSINDPVLARPVNFSRSELEAGKETDVLNRCLTIIDKANSITATAPEEFKITPNLIAQATTVAAAINPDKAERDIVSGTRTTSTAQLGSLFNEARLKLKIVDDFIEGDADDNSADFVHSYFIMRKTVNHSGGGSKKDNNPTDGTAPTA